MQGRPWSVSADQPARFPHWSSCWPTCRHAAVVDVFFRTLADSARPAQRGRGAVRRRRRRRHRHQAHQGTRRPDHRPGPRAGEHGSMPRTAIATGMVDWVLPVAGHAARLLAYFRLEKRWNCRPRRPAGRAHDARSRRSEAGCARCSASCAPAPAATSPTTSAPPCCAASRGACRSTASTTWAATSTACARGPARRRRCCRTC
jgi:hypothetical protein